MTDHNKQPKSANQSSDKQGDFNNKPISRTVKNTANSTWLVCVLKWLLAAIVAILLLLAVLFYAAGTQQGTAFLLDKVASETGVQLKYHQGNLRDGVWVQDLSIQANENIVVRVDRAYVQLGWRSLFDKQVHLVKPQIDTLTIINHKAPTGEPFDYQTVVLPFDLHLEQVQIGKISYEQATKKPVLITDIRADKADWQGSKITLANANLQYADDVNIANGTGFLDMSGDYPLSLDADVKVAALDKVYFDTLAVKAGGTLKQTIGTLTSKYNQHDVRGGFVAQGLDEDVPFSAWLDFERVVLPYAQSQNITLSNGRIDASGVISKIELRINSDLTGKDIPTGRYRGRGVVRDGGMDIGHLAADTSSGELYATGKMEWSEHFELDADFTGDGFNLRTALPKQYAQYQAYLPQTLDGKLAFKYRLQDKAGDSRFDFDLNQKQGEKVVVSLRQNRANDQAPWLIDANWQSLKRDNLPNIGELDSPSGTASIRIEQGRTHIIAQANINKLSTAPEGDYALTTTITKDGQHIDVADLKYQGVMGNLAGNARIELAKDNQPLIWQADLTTQKLLPSMHKLTKDLPIDSLSGRLQAAGKIFDRPQGAMHQIAVADSDLVAYVVQDGKSQRVRVNGAGNSQLQFANDKLQHLTASFDGKVEQALFAGLPSATIGLDIDGNLSALTIKRAKLYSDAGTASAAGKLSLNDGVAWDINADFDRLNTASLVQNEQLAAVITGKLHSKGGYRQNMLQPTSVRFDGQVMNRQLPAGDLSIDAMGDGKKFTVKSLKHHGQTGQLLASGTLDLSKGVAWDLQSDLQDFDTSVFAKDFASKITGRLRVRGDWQDSTQTIAIDEMDLHGRFNGQPLMATGALYAELNLPKDIQGYLDNLKKAAHRPRSRSELLSLRGRIDANTRTTQNIIKKLKADRMSVRIGDNTISMNGDDANILTSVQITDLGQIYSKARGTIQGGVIVINDDNALPTLYVDMAASGVRMPQIVIQNAQVIGKIVNLGNSQSQLLMQGDDIIVMGKVIKSARLDFAGTESNHIVSLSAKNADIETTATVQGAFNRKTMRYAGVLSNASLGSRFGKLTQKQPTEFAYGLSDNSVLVAAHCWQATNAPNRQVSTQNNQGVLCLQDNLLISEKQGNVNVVVQNLDTQIFSAILPGDIHWYSTLNGRAKVQWQDGQKPVVDAILSSEKGRLGLDQVDTGYVEMPYQRAAIVAKSVEQGLQIRTDVAGTAGVGYADIVINPYHQQKPIAGKIAMSQMNLAVLRPFFPNLQTLTGKIDATGDVGGTLSKPLVYGNAVLNDGSLAIADVPMALKNIQAVAKIDGSKAVLTGEFLAGDGKGNLTGELDWRGDLQAKMGISGENLQVVKQPLVTARINPDFEIIVRPKQKYVDIQGVLAIPTAVIRPPEATQEITTESDDVSVLDRRIGGNVDQILAVVEPWSINANIGVDLGRAVEFRGFGASLPLAGALHLTQVGRGVMQAKGVIQVAERKQIDGIGQNLELNYAQVRFDGNMLNPRLSIEGEKQIEGQTIGVRIRGTAGNPVITVFNDAGLTEQQAMNALVTGRIGESGDSQITEQGFRSQVTNQLAAAGLSLGLSGTRNLTNQIGRAIGLQSLTIDASGNSSDTNVNVTGYLTPDLYIRYGIGVFNAESSLSMRYQLTRRVYVEATSATENLVDVIYRWKF